MCGIAGFWQIKGDSGDIAQIVRSMTDAIAHRGPDSDGFWVDKDAGIALGHRRLAIVDLSPQGAQPMFSASERFAISFNGEIYNFQELRAELEEKGQAPQFRGTSDTEVLLACIEAWGFEAAIKRFTGMFAIALWDRKEQVLYLTRDRLGEKPVYYAWLENTLVFASDLLALSKHPLWKPEVNRDALTLLMRHGYIAAPHSIYKNVYKLPPASYLTITAGQVGQRLEPVPYWSAKDAAEGWQKHAFTGSETEAIDALEKLLSKTIHDQMISDVPLGAFLSGGVDSSLIVSLMQAQSSQPIRTFTIGFNEKLFDEAPHARAVAKHLGTQHTEVYLTDKDALDVIPKLGTLYSEPFADPSQIPTFLVSQVARRDVTVALSGDAGDELFLGYDRYFRAEQAYRKLMSIPQWAQSAGATVLQAVPDAAWDVMYKLSDKNLGHGRTNPVQKLRKWSEYLPVESPENIYNLQFIYPDEVVLNANVPATAFSHSEKANVADAFHQMSYLDLQSYLPDDILAKVDRASMGVSLEVRVPMLNHEVVEFAYTIPTSMKVRNGKGKWLLRQLLYKYVPKELIERPKQGFGVPIDSWLRVELRDWAEALLDESRLKNEGFFASAVVRQKWEDHLSGNEQNQYFLWNALMFQQWQETWL